MESRQDLQARFAAAGQAHVFRFFDALSSEQQEHLLAELRGLDLEYVHRAMADAPKDSVPAVVEPYGDVIRRDDAMVPEALAAGRAALERGEVGVLLVAGGAGTRLGFDGPKGLFRVGPLSQSSLFQLHAERLVAAGARYGKVPPLYVMTSPENHDETCRFWADEHRFGLPEDRLLIFPQGQAPAVDSSGRLLMAAKDRLVLSPNGNGGLFLAMEEGGAFEHMRGCGVEMISYVQVDNALADGADPLFCGVHVLKGADFSCKAMPKVAPLEKVGNYALVDGSLGIVEYFEISDALAHGRDAQGQLLFNYGNPGLFMWSRGFAEQQAARRDLPIHRAHKKIAHIGPDGDLVEPESPNGFKLEMFALDTLAAARQPALLAIDRDAEFAPVKNASGVDSADSARALMGALHARWLHDAGFVCEPGVQVEISPIFALDPEQLHARLGELADLFETKRISENTYLCGEEGR